MTKAYLTRDASGRLRAVAASSLVREPAWKHERVHPEHGPAELVYNVEFETVWNAIENPGLFRPLRAKAQREFDWAVRRLAARGR